MDNTNFDQKTPAPDQQLPVQPESPASSVTPPTPPAPQVSPPLPAEPPASPPADTPPGPMGGAAQANAKASRKSLYLILGIILLVVIFSVISFIIWSGRTVNTTPSIPLEKLKTTSTPLSPSPTQTQLERQLNSVDLGSPSSDLKGLQQSVNQL